MAARRVLLALVVLLVGCETQEKACSRLAETPPSLEMGTGARAWEPLGEELGFEFGPQGGYHVYGSLRSTGIWWGNQTAVDDTTPLLSFTLAAVDGWLEGGFRGFPALFRPVDDVTAELIGEQLVIDSWDADEAEGVTVSLDAEVTDACGRSASASAQVVLTQM